MYTLRIITEAGVKTNQLIGDFYNVVDEHSPDDFVSCLDICWPDRKDGDTHAKEVYAFIGFNEREVTRPLYLKQSAYIVMPNGETFENLTHHSNR